MNKLVIAAAFVACGHPAPATFPSAAVPSAAVPSAAEPDGALSVQVHVRARRGRLTFDVAPDDTLRTNDCIELRIAVNVAAYLYVIQLAASGDAVVLFPRAGDLMVASGVSTRVPAAASDWYQLDEHAGTETLYVVASREPVSKIDHELGDEIRAIRSPGLAATLVVPTTPASSRREASGRDARPAQPGPRRARPERMLTMGARGLHEVAVIGGQSVVETAVPVKEGVVVAWFSFQHDN